MSPLTILFTAYDREGLYYSPDTKSPIMKIEPVISATGEQMIDCVRGYCSQIAPYQSYHLYRAIVKQDGEYLTKAEEAFLLNEYTDGQPIPASALYMYGNLIKTDDDLLAIGLLSKPLIRMQGIRMKDDPLTPEEYQPLLADLDRLSILNRQMFSD